MDIFSQVAVNNYIPKNKCLFYSFGSGDWTQGLVHARQVLYHISHATSPEQMLLWGIHSLGGKTGKR
jgi:hypothetical protein